MTKTRKYEGHDIGELLERVRMDHGADAKIVAANRCRSGGIAGFFATEGFEVIVEISESGKEPSPKRRVGRAERAAGDRVKDRDTPASSLPTLPARDSRQTRVRPARPARVRSSDESDTSPALASLIAAADAAERYGSGEGRSRPRASGNDEFSSVLERAVGSVGRGDRFDGSLPDAGEPGRTASPDQSGRRVRRRLLGRKRRLGHTRNSAQGGHAAGTSDRVVDIAALERAGLVPSLTPPASEPGGRRHGGIRRGDETSTAALSELGVPSRWLLQQSGGHASLGAVLANLTPPPPMITTPGTTIAVVGELGLVVDVARALCVALRQDPGTCVLLTTALRPDGFRGEVINIIDELPDRREQWARRSTVTVVAVDIGFARHDITWGRLAVHSLRPTMRWGAIGATRKAEDVRAWARGIGGLHALAVTGMSETASPASILESGVPVGRIDGQVASRDLWQRLLQDRLGDAARMPDLVAN